ncbi:MAG: helix-turn-helix domain-containing protein [Shewanella sp.]|uniref:helix-turn-helix domain-containing protein n=1 Tax=Shewanella sp. TaxID=50422 RepID=UPI003C7525F6
MQFDNVHDAPQKRIVQTTDVDEQAHNLTLWQQIYDQTSNGQFYGCIEGIDYPDSHVFKEFTQRALRQQCNIAPESLWLGIPALSTDSKINGLQVESHHFMCRSSDCEFELITPDDFDIYGVVINRDTLLTMADIQGLTLKDVSNQCCARLATSPTILAQTRTTIEQLISHNHLGLHTQLQQDILNTLVLTLLTDNHVNQQIAPSYHHRLTVVEQAKDYIQQHPHQAITITQLCQHTHVSRRTLQYSFESILGINPLRFLRLTRLNNVRRELKKPQQDKPIAVIAANWGFWHPGQFTKDYTKLFAENPSQTRNRFQY